MVVRTVADYPLAEAARRLGTSTEALRARLKRQTIEGFRDNRGRWRVVLPDVESADLTLRTLRERVAFLEGKLEGVEARVADLTAERDRLLGIVEQAQAALARRRRGALTRFWQRLFGQAEKGE